MNLLAILIYINITNFAIAIVIVIAVHTIIIYICIS